MLSRSIVHLVIIISFHITVICKDQPIEDDGYLDPTDLFNFDAVNMRMIKQPQEGDIHHHTDKGGTSSSEHMKDQLLPQQEEIGSHHKVNNCHGENPKLMKFETAHSLFRQYVMTLFHMLETKVNDVNEPVYIDLRVLVTLKDMSKLKEFGTGKASDFADAYETLTRILQYASDDKPLESHIYWLEDKFGLSLSVISQIMIIGITILAMMVMLPRVHISWRFLRLLLFLVFLVSACFTWQELYQKEVADRERTLMDSMRGSCPKIEELTWWEKTASFLPSFLPQINFKEDKCKEYMRAVIVNPVTKVSPIEAVAVAFVKTFCTPLEIIGTGIKSFLTALLKDLPLQLQICIVLVLGVLVILTPFLANGYKLEIPFFLRIGPSLAVLHPQNIEPERRTPAIERSTQEPILHQRQNVAVCNHCSSSRHQLNLPKAIDSRSHLTNCPAAGDCSLISAGMDKLHISCAASDVEVHENNKSNIVAQQMVELHTRKATFASEVLAALNESKTSSTSCFQTTENVGLKDEVKMEKSHVLGATHTLVAENCRSQVIAQNTDQLHIPNVSSAPEGGGDRDCMGQNTDHLHIPNVSNAPEGGGDCDSTEKENVQMSTCRTSFDNLIENDQTYRHGE